MLLLNERELACNPDLSGEIKKLTVRIADGKSKEFRGRLAWTLAKLIGAGASGITAAELPAGVRLSHYIFVLRCDGIPIATEQEKHRGAFSGTHARYVLTSPVEVIGGEQ